MNSIEIATDAADESKVFRAVVKTAKNLDNGTVDDAQRA